MNRNQKILTPRVVVQMLFFVVVIPLLPLLISQDWEWWQAWVYAAVAVLGFVVSRLLAAKQHPDLIAERARFLQHADAAAWDKTLAPLVGLGGGLVPLTAGLDRLFNSNPAFGPAAEIVSLLVILGGYGLGAWALTENRFFSGMVRVQRERGHTVVSGGPYRWLRHPGYAGALLTYLATPFFLGSPWALGPAVLLAAVLIARTHLEDRFLQDHLEGYPEYVRRVRYRLIPGVW